MNYRRYYPKGSKKTFVINDEQFNKMVKDLGFERAVDKDNADIELIPEDDKEQIDMFFKSCDNVLRYTRFYMDNLDKIPTFRVNYALIYEYLEKNPPKPKDL